MIPVQFVNGARLIGMIALCGRKGISNERAEYQGTLNMNMNMNMNSSYELLGQKLVDALAKRGETATIQDNGPYYRNKIESADGIVIEYCTWSDGYAVEINPRFIGNWKEKQFNQTALAILAHYKKQRDYRAYVVRCNAALAEAVRLNKRFRLRKNALYLAAHGDSIRLEMSVEADAAQIRAMAKVARACGLMK